MNFRIMNSSCMLFMSVHDVRQAACLSVVQFLTATREDFDEEEEEEEETDSECEPPLEAAPAVPMVTGKPRLRKTRPHTSPVLPEVTRIMEMGFQRKQVEYAIKSLGRVMSFYV